MAHPQLQRFLPQRALSHLAGFLANSTWPWLKTRLIAYFLKRYVVDLTEAIEPDPNQYPSFNAFFSRLLKPELRPISQGLFDLTCPADGTVSEFGSIQNAQLLQAKGHLFSVDQLLGAACNDSIAQEAAHFKTGSFMTVYLAPQNYHRVHMPIDAHLRHMIYIPGRLFSVNFQTAAHIPNLFADNERLVCFFESTQGPFAMVLVGAMLVSSIETTWAGSVGTDLRLQHYAYGSTIHLKRGEEMGLFKLGSTVIMLFSNQAVIEWDSLIQTQSSVLMGQKIGTFKSVTDQNSSPD